MYIGAKEIEEKPIADFAPADAATRQRTRHRNGYWKKQTTATTPANQDIRTPDGSRSI